MTKTTADTFIPDFLNHIFETLYMRIYENFNFKAKDIFHNNNNSLSKCPTASSVWWSALNIIILDLEAY